MEKTLSNPHFGNFAKKLTDPLFCAKKSQTNKSTSSKFYSIFLGGGIGIEIYSWRSALLCLGVPVCRRKGYKAPTVDGV